MTSFKDTLTVWHLAIGLLLLGAGGLVAAALAWADVGAGIRALGSRVLTIEESRKKDDLDKTQLASDLTQWRLGAERKLARIETNILWIREKLGK